MPRDFKTNFTTDNFKARIETLDRRSTKILKRIVV